MNNLNLDAIKKRTYQISGDCSCPLDRVWHQNKSLIIEMLQFLWLKLISLKSTKCRRTKRTKCPSLGEQNNIKNY